MNFELIKEKQDKLIVEMDKNGYKQIESSVFVNDKIGFEYVVTIKKRMLL